MNRIVNRRRTEGGFSLVEALVALVVLAVGLLGIAALYLDSLRAGRTALLRSQAVTIAADIADRIRSNRNAVLEYEVALGETADVVPECENDTGCSAVDLAATDITRWKETLELALPEGDGSIDVTAGNPNIYDIRVEWAEVGQADPATFTMRIET